MISRIKHILFPLFLHCNHFDSMELPARLKKNGITSTIKPISQHVVIISLPDKAFRIWIQLLHKIFLFYHLLFFSSSCQWFAQTCGYPDRGYLHCWIIKSNSYKLLSMATRWVHLLKPIHFYLTTKSNKSGLTRSSNFDACLIKP